MEQFAEWLSHNIIQIIIIGSIFIQITPIKWNPISSLIKWFGKLLTEDVSNKVEELTETTTNLTKEVTENEKDRIRWEILDFANSCRNGRKHTHDEFKHIITLNDKYKKLLEKTHDKNGVFDAEYDYIKKLYAERLEKNDFL